MEVLYGIVTTEQSEGGVGYSMAGCQELKIVLKVLTKLEDMKKYIKTRRQGAKERLANQLSSKKKTEKKSRTKKVDLTAKDTQRIEKEIEILNRRI